MRKFLFYPVFLLLFASIMVLLMWSVYLIPVEKIRDNMVQSTRELNLTPKTLWYNYNVPGERIDKITDARMLNMASILRYKSAFDDSLLNPETYYEWWAPNNLRYSLSDAVLQVDNVRIYPRFWHGYLIFLKPLSLFFTLLGIRFLNLIVQVILLFMVCYLIYKRMSFREVIGYLAAMLFLNPVTSWMCLEYATDINIMLLASILVLLNKNKDNDRIFFITGAVTIAFDFITFPLITLGIPLILHMALYERSFKDSIKCVIKNTLLWFIGYSLMWLLKWGIVTVFIDENIFNEVWGHIVHRSYGHIEADSIDVAKINYVNALKLNFAGVYTPFANYYLSAFVVLIALSYFIWPYKLKLTLKSLIFLGIALMPFIWYAVLINHSVIHPFFTYRTFVISIFAIFMAGLCCCREVKKI